MRAPNLGGPPNGGGGTRKGDVKLPRKVYVRLPRKVDVRLPRKVDVRLPRKVDVRLPLSGGASAPRRWVSSRTSGSERAGPPNHHDDKVDSDQ